MQVFDFGEIDGSYYMTMEYLAGEDLRSILAAARRKGQQVPLPIALQIGVEICDGLEYAHSAVDEAGELPVGVSLVRAHRHDCQPCPLPEVVVLDLGCRHVELLQPVLDPPKHHALVLQGPGTGQMQLDGEQADNHEIRP